MSTLSSGHQEIHDGSSNLFSQSGLHLFYFSLQTFLGGWVSVMCLWRIHHLSSQPVVSGEREGWPPSNYYIHRHHSRHRDTSLSPSLPGRVEHSLVLYVIRAPIIGPFLAWKPPIPYARNKQNIPGRGLWMRRAGSLWHKRAGGATLIDQWEPSLDIPGPMRVEQAARHNPVALYL